MRRKRSERVQISIFAGDFDQKRPTLAELRD
jgi:hypothetical protein